MSDRVNSSGEWSCALCQENNDESAASDVEEPPAMGKRQAPSGLTKTEMKVEVKEKERLE